MFDVEDALGQVDSISLDNQRNLKLACARDDVFMKVAAEVAGGLFRPRGLHLDDQHVRRGGRPC